MLGQVAAGQQAAVYLGVKRLHAAVADLGESGHLADADGLDPALLEQFLRTAGGDDFPTKRLQSLYEGDQARFVADTD